MAEKKPDLKKLAQTRPGLASRRGNSIGSGSGRLQSLRTPRDLTLGGTSKRTYSPTIPVRRIKEEPKDASEQPKVKHERGHTRQRGRGRERGRGRGRGQSKIIQSKSIFSEGLVPKTASAQPRAPSYGGGVGGGFGGEGSESGGVKVRPEKDLNVGDSHKILEMVGGDGQMDIDEDQLQSGVLPFHIPLAYHDRFVEEVQEGEDITSVKSEKMETDDKRPFIKPSALASKKKSNEEQMTCELLLTGEDAKKKEQMLLFQFPDSLPTMIFDEEKSNSKSKNKSLKDISEGYIGKIQIYKSGKTRLILGNASMDISMGTPCNFLQDIVSIRPQEESRSMMTLGHVKQRLVCTPDFTELLKHNQDDITDHSM